MKFYLSARKNEEMMDKELYNLVLNFQGNFTTYQKFSYKSQIERSKLVNLFFLIQNTEND